jgi:ABC-type multidrug transport system fused ATPase/permease subunit
MLKDMKFIFRLMGKNKGRYSVLLAAWSIIGSLVDMTFSYALKLLTDFFVYKEKENVLLLILVFSASIVSSILFCVFFHLHNKVKEDILRDIRMMTFKEVQKLPSSYFKATHSGDLVSRFNAVIFISSSVAPCSIHSSSRPISGPNSSTNIGLLFSLNVT